MTVNIPALPVDILRQTHTLIAGTTGSGKSVLLDSVMYSFFCDPSRRSAVLIDPKRVELSRFRSWPSVWACETEPDMILSVLRSVLDLMDRRYIEMQRRGERQYSGVEVYVVIDELADLSSLPGFLPLLVRLGRLGRAAGIHIIAATQSPDRKTIPAQLQQNFPARVALRCRDRIESRQILGAPGAEMLPKYGKALYYTPDTLQPIMVDVQQIQPGQWEAMKRFHNITR